MLLATLYTNEIKYFKDPMNTVILFCFFYNRLVFPLFKILMGSYLRTLSKTSSPNTSSNSSTNVTGERLLKWALTIGVPITVCVAAYLVYRQQEKQAKKSVARRSSLLSSLSRANGDTVTTLEDRVQVKLK